MYLGSLCTSKIALSRIDLEWPCSWSLAWTSLAIRSDSRPSSMVLLARALVRAARLRLTKSTSSLVVAWKEAAISARDMEKKESEWIQSRLVYHWIRSISVKHLLVHETYSTPNPLRLQCEVFRTEARAYPENGLSPSQARMGHVHRQRRSIFLSKQSRHQLLRRPQFCITSVLG